ncbi:lysylphosphatidylglycerol synthase transmembrane domain-containing protein [Gryllotalpicola sp.]|uniref:lysylphosphatidylglycerol synthase transmembrane domain-containing protein n=1 Tax=Gryllotalpicola sp. TaxID=1932787 RepID=UPI002627707D|nr:lysylphosphatidylglycerol synthase transmembrane domain-containing protein [Gryllotalpicola sp.]
METSRRAADTRRRRRRQRLLSWVSRIAVSAIVVLLLWLVVIPQLITAARSATLLSGRSVPLIVAAVACGLASIACYAGLTHSVLPRATRPSWWRVALVDLAGLATTNSLPVGGPVATALRLRLLGGSKTAYEGAVAGLALELPVSGILLSALFIAGMVPFLPGLPGGYWQAIAIVIVIGILAILVVLGLAIRHRIGIIHAVAALVSWLPEGLWRNIVVFANGTVRSMAGFGDAPGRIGTAALWSAGSWAFNGIALWLFLLVAGFQPDAAEVALAFGTASVLGLVPITPGGIGVVEGVMVPMLIGFGATADQAALAVTGWRLGQFWLPIPLGVLAGIGLGVSFGSASVLQPPGDDVTGRGAGEGSA